MPNCLLSMSYRSKISSMMFRAIVLEASQMLSRCKWWTNRRIWHQFHQSRNRQIPRKIKSEKYMLCIRVKWFRIRYLTRHLLLCLEVHMTWVSREPNRMLKWQVNSQKCSSNRIYISYSSRGLTVQWLKDYLIWLQLKNHNISWSKKNNNKIPTI